MEARGLSERLTVKAIIELLLARILARTRGKHYPCSALQTVCSSVHAHTDFLLFCLYRELVAKVRRIVRQLGAGVERHYTQQWR
jgi:hypothetical protein